MIGLILRPHVSRGGSLESHETFNRLAGAAAVACIREGIGLVHIPTRDDAPLSVLPMDGCIVAYPNSNDPVIDELISRGIPVVCADPDPARPDICPWAGVDYASGIAQVLETLVVDAGDEVWLMVGSEDNAWRCASERVASAWARTEDLDLRIHRTWGQVRPTGAREGLQELLQRNRPPRAIIYARSDLTEPVVSAIGASGLRIPRDIQLAALTDSAHARIPLTSVTALDLNQEGLAQAAVSQMLRALKGPTERLDPLQVSPHLKVRASTRGTPRQSR